MIKLLPDECPAPASGLPTHGSQHSQHWFGVELRRAGWDVPGTPSLHDGMMVNQMNGWQDQDDLARTEGFA